MLKRKIWIIIIIVILLGGITTLLIADTYRPQSNSDDDALNPVEEVLNDITADGPPVPADVQPQIDSESIISQNLSLYDEELTTGNEDYYPFKVMITNRNEFGSTALSDYAVYSLEEYLHRYVTYYATVDEMYWEAEYVNHSFQNDTNFPTFKLILHSPDEDIPVTCRYSNCDKRYIFESKLN